MVSTEPNQIKFKYTSEHSTIMFKNQENRKYLTMSLLAIIAVMAGTLAISQILETAMAQTTGNNTGNQTGNQTGHPLAKLGALKNAIGGK